MENFFFNSDVPIFVTIIRLFGALFGSAILNFILYGAIVKIARPNMRLIFVPFVIQCIGYFLIGKPEIIVISLIPNAFFYYICNKNSKKSEPNIIDSGSTEKVIKEEIKVDFQAILNSIRTAVPNAIVTATNKNTDPIEFVYTFATNEEAESYSLQMESTESYAFEHWVKQSNFFELRPRNSFNNL